jgi:hypothetical protein
MDPRQHVRVQDAWSLIFHPVFVNGKGLERCFSAEAGTAIESNQGLKGIPDSGLPVYECAVTIKRERLEAGEWRSVFIHRGKYIFPAENFLQKTARSPTACPGRRPYPEINRFSGEGTSTPPS